MQWAVLTADFTAYRVRDKALLRFDAAVLNSVHNCRSKRVTYLHTKQVQSN